MGCSNLPYTNHLATNCPAPLLDVSSLAIVGILVGSITRVRVPSSQWRLRPSSDPNQPEVTNLVHPFTHGMITTLTCGYCSVRLNSLNDLRCHLSSVQYHSVFSCCGRFFKRESDLWKHRAAKPNHNYAVTRNARSPADTAGSVV